MKINANEVISFVAGKMNLSDEGAQKALCIADKEMVIELQDVHDKSRYAHVTEHDLDASKVDLEKIADSLNLPVREFTTYVEDDMIWIVYGPNIVEGVVGEGPDAKLATASFYRDWYKQKVFRPNS
jgi:hypothetical protein